MDPEQALAGRLEVRIRVEELALYRRLAVVEGHRTVQDWARAALARAARAASGAEGEERHLTNVVVPQDVLYQAVERGGRLYTFREVAQIVADNPELIAKFNDPEAAVPYFFNNQSRLASQLQGLQYRRERELRSLEEEETKEKGRHGRDWERYRGNGVVHAPESKVAVDARSLWVEALRILERQVSGPTYRHWLACTEGAAMDDQMVVVEAPTVHELSWLQGHLYHAMASALTQAAGRPVHLVLRAREVQEIPISNGVTSHAKDKGGQQEVGSEDHHKAQEQSPGPAAGATPAPIHGVRGADAS